MSLRSPLTAPPRPDLTFLRRRARPQPVAAAPTPAPAGTSSLDLSTPRAPARPPPPTPTATATPAYSPPRIRAGSTVVLTRTSASVTLRRVQSGVGALTIEAACSTAVGDLRLGCAYQLRTGATSVVQHATGVTAAPPHARRPVIVALREKFERLTVDLAQVRDLDRFVVYAFSESDDELRWGGTLVVTTFGQARLDVSMDRPASRGVAVLFSAFNIAGELVLRAEFDQPAATVRDACLAYGFDRITWLDARTPLVDL